MIGHALPIFIAFATASARFRPTCARNPFQSIAPAFFTAPGASSSL